MYVAIAGNIGSGKTTLTEMLTRRYGAKAYYEETDNPYIGDFYNDMSRWAFHLQISFLGSRIRQTLDMLADGSDYIFQDRTIYEDAHIFADNLHEMGLMTSRDFMTYMRIFDLTTNLVPQPDVLIYLRASIPTLVAQIKRRGREYARVLPAERLLTETDLPEAEHSSGGAGDVAASLERTLTGIAHARNAGLESLAGQVANNVRRLLGASSSS